MTTTIRLGDELEERLKRVADSQGMTKSELVRSVIESHLDQVEKRKTSGEIAKDLCGAYSSGDPDASRRDIGEIVREKHRLIRAKHERRSR
jgi:predicted DNA-binding protein